MSKWTLIRKTEATRFDRLQKLWEGCFEMKVDRCKNEGAARFDFQIRIVNLMFTIEIEQHYKTLWRLADVID